MASEESWKARALELQAELEARGAKMDAKVDSFLDRIKKSNWTWLIVIATFVAWGWFGGQIGKLLNCS